MKTPVEKFYNNISAYYDDMTNFQRRLERERRIMEKWIGRYRFKSVLDAACGSGLHTIILNNLGVSTVGVDISPEMIKRARENATGLALKPNFIQSSLQDLDEKIEQKFDAVFFLGNSVPHIHSKDELTDTLTIFRNLLITGGKLIIQQLNYDRILNKKDRIVSINRNHNQEYIRFYDFLHGIIRFNILHINCDHSPCKYTMEHTDLYPYPRSELVGFIQKSGYKIINLFGTMDFDPFDENNSKDLVVIAEKQ